MITIKSVEDQTTVSLKGKVMFTLPVTAQEFQRNLLARLVSTHKHDSDDTPMAYAVRKIIAGRKGQVWSWTPQETGHSFIRGVKDKREVMHVRPYGLQHQPYCVKGYV